MLENILPLSLGSCWYSRAHPAVLARITSSLLPWLFEQGSLTQKLKTHCQHLTVKVLAKQQRWLTDIELQTMSCCQQRVHVREVLLFCDGQPWVYAQTLIPLEQVPKNIKPLIDLGASSLGEIIFNLPEVQRGEIEVSCFEPDSCVYQLVTHLQQASVEHLWGRRSVFRVDQYPLMVTEIFLPASGLYS